MPSQKHSKCDLPSSVEPRARQPAFQIRARRPSVLPMLSGSSGVALASEPWQMIFHTCLPRVKQRRKSSVEGLTQPTSPSVKSPTERRCRISQSCPESCRCRRPLRGSAHGGNQQATGGTQRAWGCCGMNMMTESSQCGLPCGSLNRKNICSRNTTSSIIRKSGQEDSDDLGNKNNHQTRRTCVPRSVLRPHRKKVLTTRKQVSKLVCRHGTDRQIPSWLRIRTQASPSRQ